LKKNSIKRASPEIAPEIEVFDRMAAGWYGFRHHSIFRPELEMLARHWEKGRLLNIGSGHGPDFLPFKEGFDLYGVDFSGEMIRLARRYSRKFEFPVNLQIADARYLPFADKSFDWAISVATYHHLKGREEQLKALNELRRVLKPGGEAFLTVWNRCQPRFWSKRKEVGIPWRAEGRIIYRYYYLFTYWEFEGLAKKAGLQVLRSFPEARYCFPLKYFSRNICLLVKKSQASNQGPDQAECHSRPPSTKAADQQPVDESPDAGDGNLYRLYIAARLTLLNRSAPVSVIKKV
jgi:tRNA (uracil-5-)-methyltransferase TRM9